MLLFNVLIDIKYIHRTTKYIKKGMFYIFLTYTLIYIQVINGMILM